MTEEVSAEVIKKTQKSLGKYVKKPPLTDKLLKKPPFRFLHDVVSTIVKDTGFLKGLFTEDELVSDNVKDKDAKVAFLNKLIEAVKTLSESNLPVKASKIVAGLEPVNTNLLLQAIGRSLDQKVDSTQYVSGLNKADNKNEKEKLKKSTTKIEKSKGTSRTHKDEKDSDKASVKSTEKKSDASKKNKTISSVRKEDKREIPVKIKKSNKQEEKLMREQSTEKESPKSNSLKKDSHKKEPIQKEKAKDEPAKKESTKPKESARKQNSESSSRRNSTKNESIEVPKIIESTPKLDSISTTDENQNSTVTNTSVVNDNAEVEKISNGTEGEENVPKPLVRPKSARPKSGDYDKLKSVAKEEPMKQEERPKHLEVADVPHPKPPPPVRPKSSLRPPSVRPSSARPGAPRLRPDSAFPLQEPVPMGTINVIVENVDATAADEEETVVIETVSAEPEVVSEAPQVDLDNKGHLVEQILEQIEGESGGAKRKTDIDWENNATRNKEGATKDITQLAGFIQNLTKTANPLGKLINFLHEDIEAMHTELQLWINTKKQLYAEITKQKKSSVESNKPLLAHLGELNQETKKIQQEITHIHSNILKNDTRIKELLCK